MQPTQPGQYPHASQPKSGAGKKTLLIVGCVLGFVLLAVSFIAVFAIGRAVEPEPGDRELMITVDELNETFDLSISIDRSSEVFGRERYIDGSFSIDYEYEHPDDAQPLYLTTTINHENNSSDASAVYAGCKIGLELGINIGADGVELREDRALLQWGDQSEAGWVVYEDRQVGVYVLAREGADVYTFLITGLTFEPGDLQALLSEHLEAMRAADL